MADADYRAWVEVLPDFSEFNATVQSAVVGGMASAGSTGSAALGGGLVAGVGRFAGPLLAVIAGLGIAGAISDQVQSGFDAAVSYVSGSVQLASDLNESINAVTVAYEDQAQAVLALGRDAPATYGVTSLALNEFAVRFSGFAGRIAGEGGDVAATLESIIARGTDFASVYNIDVAEALRLFQSGLAGEMEPLRRYGIDLSMATVKTYAYANGIAEQGKALTDTQRVQATYLALMDQTAKTQGDFADTSDELANSTRILQAEFDEVAADFGKNFLPVLTDVMEFARDELIPLWKDFNDELGPELKAAFEEMWPHIKRLIEELLPLLPPLIETLIGAITWLSDTIDENIVRWTLIIGTIRDFFALLNGDITVQEFVANWRTRWNEWFSIIQSRLAESLVIFGTFGARVLSFFRNLGTQLFNSGRAMITQLMNGVKASLGFVGSTMGQVASFILSFLPHSPADRGPFSGAGWSGIRESGRAIMSQFAAGLEPVEVPLSAVVPDVPVRGRALAGAVAAVPAPVVSVVVQPKGGIDLLKYIDISMEQRDASAALDVGSGGVA